MSEKTAPTSSQDSGPIGEISQEPSAFEAFLDANQKRLVIVGIIAILALVGYVIYDGLNKMATQKAAAAIAAARTVPEYEAASKEFEGKNAGGTALILKSQLLWRDKQQQEAIKTLEEFTSSYPEHPAFGSAKTSLGSYHQELGNLEEAKGFFKEAAALQGATSSLATLSLGDIAAQEGKIEEARGYYNSIISDEASLHVQVKTMAEQRLKIVGVDAPTIAIPQAPVTGPTPGAPSAISNPINIPGITPEVPLSPLKPIPTPVESIEIPAPTPPETTEPLEVSETTENSENAETTETPEAPEGN